MKLIFSIFIVCFISQVFSQTCPGTGCGNGVCETGREDCNSCPFDCGLCPSCDNICGNNLCETAALENGCNCPQDCGVCCPDQRCRGAETAVNCPSDCTATLRGLVYDADTLVSLSGATIACETSGFGNLPLSSATAQDGTFGFGAQAGGHYKCRASLAGYISNSQSIWFLPGSEFNYNSTFVIPLRVAKAHLVGAVWHSELRAGVRSANVSCLTPTGEVNTFTAPGGSFYFKDITPGNYTCKASLPRYSTDTHSVTVVRGNTTFVNFTITPGTGRILGSVIDRSTGQPVTAAQIVCRLARTGALLNPSPLFTDTAGSFLYTGVAAGDYICNATKFGYLRGQAQICLDVGENGTVSIVLQQVPAVINGTVTDVDTREVIFGASIRCVSSSTSGAITTTDQNGRYTLLNVAASPVYICSASADQYTSQELSASINPGTITTINFQLTPAPNTVFGNVYDIETLVGLRDFSISCNNTRLVRLYSNSTGALGAYSISGIPSGATVCTASGPRFESASVPLTLFRGQSIRLDFSLRPLRGSLSVGVLDALTRMGIGAAIVSCTSDIGATPSFTTSLDGNATVQSVRIGVYTCNATAERYDPSGSQTTTIVTNTASRLVFALSPAPGTVFGRAYDAENGQPIQGASVACTTTGVNTGGTATTNVTGEYTIPGMAPGAIACNANAARYRPATGANVLERGRTAQIDFPMLPQRAVLTVNVVDSSTQNSPISGASVTCTSSLPYSNTVVTAAAGTSEFGNLRLASYDCTASATGYAPANPLTQSISIVSEAQSGTLTFVLTPLPATITGFAFDVDFPSVDVANALITCRVYSANPRGTNSTYTATTNSTGDFTITGVTTFGPVQCSGTALPTYVSGSSAVMSVALAGSVEVPVPMNPAPITISITVRDAQTSTLLSGAAVACERVDGSPNTASGSSGPNGIATLAPTVPRGTYTCTASLFAYFANTTSVTGTAGQLVNGTILLFPLPGGIFATVLDAETRTPIPGAQVLCTSPLQTVNGTTDLTGTLVLSPLEVATYTCTASSLPTYITNTVVSSVVRNTVSNVTILLNPFIALVEGIVTNVVDAGGFIYPLDSVNVQIVGVRGNITNLQTPAADDIFLPQGYFSFRSRIPVNVTINLYDPSVPTRYQNRTSTFTFSTQSPNITIPSSVINMQLFNPVVSGQVVDFESSVGIEGASVSFITSGFNSSSRTITTGANGTYRIENLPARRNYTIVFAANGYETAQINLPKTPLLEGDVVTVSVVRLRNACCGNLRGVITDSSTNQPLAGVNVTIALSNSTSTIVAWNITGSDGVYYFLRVPAATIEYLISASKPGFSQTSPQRYIVTSSTEFQVPNPIVMQLQNIQVNGQMYEKISRQPLGQIGSYGLTSAVRLSDNQLIPGQTLGESQTTFSFSLDWRFNYTIVCADSAQQVIDGKTRNFADTNVTITNLQPNVNVDILCEMNALARKRAAEKAAAEERRLRSFDKSAEESDVKNDKRALKRKDNEMK